MTNPATRLITLIMLLQSQPNCKASELADRLGVSVRTLHRYIGMLDEMGIPVYSERGPHGGFSLVRGYKMPPLVFTPQEAVALSLGTGLVNEIWGSLYQEASSAAQAKLENVLPDEQRREIAWARRALVATGLRRPNLEGAAPLLEKLRLAVRQHQRVHMSYQGADQDVPLERQVDVYALAHRSGWWYAVGYCHLRGALRSFRVDRIIELEIMENRFDIPGDFNIHIYLRDQFKFENQLNVRLRFLPQYVYLARYTPSIWTDSREDADGSLCVTFQAQDLFWAASLVMSFGPAVVVLEPPELRKLLLEWAGAMIEMNSKNEEE
jgi:predicted DNA-binding transcriptional regulator YafY